LITPVRRWRARLIQRISSLWLDLDQGLFLGFFFCFVLIRNLGLR
jgi:hypothetical protein